MLAIPKAAPIQQALFIHCEPYQAPLTARAVALLVGLCP